MRVMLIIAFHLGFLLTGASYVWAQDDVRAIIEKAIEAHGGEKKINQRKAGQSKSTGIIHIMDGLKFNEEASFQLPDKIKTVVQIEGKGQKVVFAVGFDGRKAWRTVNGQNDDRFVDKITELMKEQLYVSRVARLVSLKDKEFELSPLGELQVEGRPAVGVRISSKDHKDVNLFFDKKTGLIAKFEHRTVDLETGKEVSEEKIVTEYMERSGEKEAKKIMVNRDGQKFIEAEVLEAKYVDKIDDSEFAKP